MKYKKLNFVELFIFLGEYYQFDIKEAVHIYIYIYIYKITELTYNLHNYW